MLKLKWQFLMMKKLLKIIIKVNGYLIKKSRKYAHKDINSQAILTTSKTIINDNPRLTVRKK